MIEGDKQALDVDGITSKSIDVYYMDFKYDRLADAGQFTEIDTEQLRLEAEGS